MLAARADGLWNIFGLSRRQHEHNVPGWLFQSFQQRIESRVGDLMSFVENINLEAVARRPVAGRLAQLTNFVDAAVSRSVNFNYIDSVPGANLSARVAHSTGLGNRLIRRAAVQGHRQNARHRSFADAAMPAEDGAMSIW